MKKYLKLIRINHWIKNFLIFLPLFFSLSFQIESIIKTFLGFISFSFISSFIYIINDIKDIEKDRKHPRKKNRPLASKSISLKQGKIIACLLFILALLLNFIVNKRIDSSLIFLMLYIFINIAYSFGLKNIAILDVVLLASGFVIRVYYGAAIIGVEVSKWLFLTILNAALFLGLGKRKKELLADKRVRDVLKEYDEKFLNNFINIFLSLVIVFYSLWAIEQTSKYIFLSIPILIVIFMKYMLIFEKNEEGDPVTLLFQNKSLICLILAYLIYVFICLVIL